MTAGSEGLAELSEILVYNKPLGGTAQDVVDLALASLDRCDGVGMQLVDQNGSSTQVSTDARSSELDALQDDLDDGPCVECLRTGELRDYEPVTSEERWPSFAPPARSAGLIACLALPLIAKADVIGVINLYAWPMNGFAGWDRPHCRSFAAQASVSLASVQAYARAQVLIAELEARVAEPDDIVDQAHGVLMVTGNTSLDDAIAQLIELARYQDGTLEEAAHSVLDSVA